MLSATFFKEHTETFFEFYRSAMLFPNAKPNKAHLFFAKLEKESKKVSVVTQNIDALHQAAGSNDVIELHGSVMRNFCQRCKKSFPLEYIINSKGIPHCECSGIIKPDVVLYEEPLSEESIIRAVNAIENADLMFVVGTSLSVYPAASYIRYFNGENLVLINKGETRYDSLATLAFNDDVINVINELESEK